MTDGSTAPDTAKRGCSMIQNNHRAILDKFGKAIGLDLTFDRDGICELVIGEIPISILSSEADGTMVLTSAVAEELPQPVHYSLLLDLLDIAFTPATGVGGNAPVIGYDRETGNVIIYLVCTASALQKQPLEEIIGEFADMCSHARALLDEETTAQQPMEQFFGNALAV